MIDSISISIVIPTYNRSKLIQRAIRSLLDQTILPDEIIVVDDGSTDDTRQVVAKFSSEYPFISYVDGGKNSGAQHARNIGIRKAKGKFVLLFDSDNELSKDYIKIVKDFLDQHQEVDVLTNYSKVINEQCPKQEIFNWKTNGNILKDILSFKTYVDYNSSLIRREKLLAIGDLDEQCPSFQEWDTAIRLAEISTFNYIPQELTVYYKHSEERISNNVSRETAGRYYVVNKHKAIWIEVAGKEAYLDYLSIIYRDSRKYGLEQFRSMTLKEINKIDPLYFKKKKYHQLTGKIKNKLARYKKIVLK